MKLPLRSMWELRPNPEKSSRCRKQVNAFETAALFGLYCGFMYECNGCFVRPYNRERRLLVPVLLSWMKKYLPYRSKYALVGPIDTRSLQSVRWLWRGEVESTGSSKSITPANRCYGRRRKTMFAIRVTHHQLHTSGVCHRHCLVGRDWLHIPRAVDKW